MNDKMGLKGHVVIKLNDKVVIDQPNLVVTSGKAFVTNAIITASTSPMTYMAIGSGTNAAALADTTLQTEVVRQVFSSATAVSNVVTLVTTYAPGVGTATISEAGIFNNSVGGTMYARTVFTGIPKGVADSLQITWTLTQG